jgi:hypothetical protein
VLGGDGTDSNTRVPIVRCVWVPVTACYRVWHQMSPLPEDPTPGAFIRY